MSASDTKTTAGTDEYEMNDAEMAQFFHLNPMNEDESVDIPSIPITIEIPAYLASNKFEQMIEEQMQSSVTATKLHNLRHITVLLHHLKSIELEISLWSHYLQAGTGESESSTYTVCYWPKELRSTMQASTRRTTISDPNEISIDDERCRIFVLQKLEQLMTQKQDYQTKLSQLKVLVEDYSLLFENRINAFIEEQLLALRSEYDQRIKSIMIDYQEHVLDQQWTEQQPNEEQRQLRKNLFDLQYQYQTAQQEFNLLQYQRTKNHFPSPIDTLQFSLPRSIQNLANTRLRQHFSDRHRILIDQYKYDMLEIYITIQQTLVYQTQQQFTQEMDQICHEQSSSTITSSLSPAMLHLINEHLNLIQEKLDCIYRSKRQ